MKSPQRRLVIKSGTVIPNEMLSARFLNVKVFQPISYNSGSLPIIISPFGLKPYLCA